MPSILVIGGNPETREQKAHTLLGGHYIHELEATRGTIGIGRVKELIPQLYITLPGGGRRGVLILEAQRLTQEAQNALLKSLEEPPASATFVLTTPHSKLLLPTVASRCLLERVRAGAVGEIKLAKRILDLGPGERLSLYEQEIGYGREAALGFLESVEITIEGRLKSKNLAQSYPLQLRSIWETKRLLREQTTNVKFAVDSLLTSW